MKDPGISVVISCYNYARYLAGCLDSVLGQEYGPLEAIVVNDGSTDDTEQVMQAYAKDPRVIYITQANQGPSSARNTGLFRARGELVAFLDADDQWKPDKLAKQRLLFADPTVAVGYCRLDYIDPDGKPMPAPERGKRLTPRSGRVTRELIFDNFVPLSSSIVRREVVQGAKGFDRSLPMGQDWDLWLRLSVDHGFAFVDEPLVRYRLGHAGQLSKNSLKRQECSDRIIRSFVDNHPELLSGRLLRRSSAYRSASRGYRWRLENPGLSNAHYLAALKSWPLEPMAYKGLLRNFLVRVTEKSRGRTVRKEHPGGEDKSSDGA